MLDRLVVHEFYCFLDGYSGYNHIAIALEDQEKTTFTCPYRDFGSQKDAIWVVQCCKHILAMHDGNILRHGREVN